MADELELRLAAVRAEREALRVQLDAEREAHKATKSQYGVTDAEVRAFIAKCQAEQGRAFCAFCGEITERADIASHISECAVHPMRSVEQERDSLRAQISALQAEHEAAALAAESRVQALSLVARAAIACADERFQAELRESLAEAMEVTA